MSNLSVRRASILGVSYKIGESEIFLIKAASGANGVIFSSGMGEVKMRTNLIDRFEIRRCESVTIKNLSSLLIAPQCLDEVHVSRPCGALSGASKHRVPLEECHDMNIKVGFGG